jgi:hypothetical protein
MSVCASPHSSSDVAQRHIHVAHTACGDMVEKDDMRSGITLVWPLNQSS